MNSNSQNRVIIVGGGIAGIECAISLKEMGFTPIVLEKEDKIGGKLNNWDRLFPDKTPAVEVVERLSARFNELKIDVRCGCEVLEIDKANKRVVITNGDILEGCAIVIASGYKLFDAELKEEYGYKIYDNVITSADLEVMFRENRLVTTKGTAPKRVALLHCVGSRDEKVGQNHCSRLCCVTGVKQAIEIKELYPDCEVYNFYMDMRMFGPGYEELYRSSQQDYGVNHIRGRISEASTTIDGRIQIRAEDTLVGRPMKMDVDMLVLLVGMCAGESNEKFSTQCGLTLRASNFMKPINPYDLSNFTLADGIFLAGSVKAPKNVSETLHDALSAARCVNKYING